jgi:hypothetical protein
MNLNKKYLVVLAGSPRGGEKTWNSLFKYVVNPLNADLAICTTDNFISKNILFQKANFHWIMENPDNFEDYYSNFFKGTWREYLEKGKGLGLFESGLIHFALKDFVYKNYKEILEKYEYIIYTRFDQYYVDYHPDLNEDKVFIPKGEDYFGICDRHVVIRSTDAQKYFSIINYIDSNDALLEVPAYPNCESVYKKHLQNSGLINKVERFDRISFTSSLRNEPTNWRVPSYKIFFTKNLMIKYPDEFLAAIKTGLKNNNKITYLLENLVVVIYSYYLLFRKFFGDLIKEDKNFICDEHGHLFLSERYKDLKICPECSNNE